MSNMIVICVLAMVVGIYTFVKHLNAFNKRKTPVKDAWLVMVGLLAWCFVLDFVLTDDDVSIHAGILLWCIYWIGDNLKIQNHCKRYISRFKTKA